MISSLSNVSSEQMAKKIWQNVIFKMVKKLFSISLIENLIHLFADLVSSKFALRKVFKIKNNEIRCTISIN